MAKWFEHLSTRWKLAIVTASTTAAALIVSGAVMANLDSRRYETQKLESLTTEARIVSANIVGALVFNDPTTAMEALSALAANPEVVAGVAYDADGQRVAQYVNAEASPPPLPERPPAVANRIQGADVVVTVPVIQNGAAVGTIFLAGHVESAGARLGKQVVTLLIIGLGAVVIVLPVSMWLHRSITNPIEELAEKTAIIHTTLDSVDHGVVVVDKDLKVTFLNNRVMRICKLAPGDLQIGMDVGAVLRRLHPGTTSDAEATVKGQLERLRAHDGLRSEYLLPDGNTIEYRQAALPDGGFVRTYTDITEQKAFQTTLQTAKAKAEDADRAKSQFLAAMSHEIRTPMNGVIGLIELLHATQLTDEQRQMVEIIRQSGTGLLDVINDILDYSKIEAGRMTIETTRFALGDVIEVTTRAISGHTKSKTLNISCKIDPAMDWALLGDPVRIRQVILNLMGNALKFTEMGSIEIEAVTAANTDDVTTVLFEVRDTGIGIPEDKISQLFDRFSQADYSTTRRFGGTGLGLSISKNLVELMGGEIGVRSVLGQGSTFWFKIPFKRLPAEERVDPFAKYRDALTGLRVLVCDRNPRKSAVSSYLRAVGLEVVEALSISQAIDGLYEPDGRRIDMMILTVHLGEDSAALLEQELVRRKSLGQTKVLLVLPNMSASAARSSKDVFQKTISSPISRVALYDAVASMNSRVMAQIRVKDDTADLNFDAPTNEDAAAHGCVVLVAEDNETNTFVIKTQMRRLGYATEFASDGRDAWQMLKAGGGRYGMVLTDCHMPYIDGYQFTGMIRDQEQDGRTRLPVVALTANALEGEADICLAAGMDDYLSKPVSLQDLDAMIRKWLPRAAELRRVAGQPATASGAPPALRPSETVNGTVPPIDMKALGILLGESDPAFLREILESFLTTMDGTPENLRDLAAGSDAAAVASAAHAAKGAAASACADSLAALCKKMEDAGRKEDWPTIRVLVSEIDTAFENVRVFIQGELSRGA